MKDFVGEELMEGNTVVFSSFKGSDLMRGVVVSITPKMVRIRIEGKSYRAGREVLRAPEYVIKYSGNISVED